MSDFAQVIAVVAGIVAGCVLIVVLIVKARRQGVRDPLLEPALPFHSGRSSRVQSWPRTEMSGPAPAAPAMPAAPLVASPAIPAAAAMPALPDEVASGIAAAQDDLMRSIAAAEEDLMNALGQLLPDPSQMGSLCGLLEQVRIRPGDVTSQPLLREEGPNPEQVWRDRVAASGLDYDELQAKLSRFLNELGLKAKSVAILAPPGTGTRSDHQDVEDVGQQERQAELDINHDFYTSLALGLVGHCVLGPTVHNLGIRLRRAIQGAVLAAHPAWVDLSQVPAHVETHLDLLKEAMVVATGDTGAFLAKLAICVLNPLGYINVFKGRSYDSLDYDARARHLLVLRHTPGRYDCIVMGDDDAKPAMDLDDFKGTLEMWDFVVEFSIP
mmetsp:Transcript_137414/g.342761  ORF Transcript_137414/g.342761 Transcript_137414/m.342761 type:complete len:383 (-) Transcript_137414:122-1270(-)